MNNTSAEFNLLQLQRHSSWYDFLDQAEAAIAHEDHITRIRTAAGWHQDEGGWYAPTGTHQSDWEDEGFPLPEDPGYGEWFRSHTGTDSPFPNASTV